MQARVKGDEWSQFIHFLSCHLEDMLDHDREGDQLEGKLRANSQ